MGRKRNTSMLTDAKLTNCSVVVEILDEMFIPRYEPGFDKDWGDHSWHVATVKKERELLPEEKESILEDNNEVKRIRENEKSCDQCNFKSASPKLLMKHILSVHSKNNGDSLSENEFTYERDTSINKKQKNIKKLVPNKKLNAKSKVITKKSTPLKKILGNNSLIKDNNENKKMVSPEKKKMAENITVSKTKKTILNMQNSFNEESSPQFDAPNMVIKKEPLSKLNKDKNITCDEMEDGPNIKLENPVSCNAIDKKSGSDSIEKKKSALVVQNDSSHNDGQTNKSTSSSLATKTTLDPLKIKRRLSNVEKNINEHPTSSAKKKKMDVGPVITEKCISNGNKAPCSLSKKKTTSSIKAKKLLSSCEKAIRKSENSLLKEIKYTIPKLNTIQKENKISNYNPAKNKSPSLIQRLIKPNEIKKEKSTVGDSSDEDTVYYSFKPQDGKVTEDQSITAKKKTVTSPCAEKLNQSDTKKTVTFKESNNTVIEQPAPKKKSDCVSGETQSTPRNLSYPLSCKYCLFRCKNDWVMQKHTLVIHNNGKYFSCKLCSYKTKVMGSFQMHHRVHSDEKPLACDQCNYKTKMAGNLNHHKICHSPLRPFKCDECPHTSKSRSHLKTHKLTHTDVKPYCCECCTYKCKSSSSLKLHQLTHKKYKPLKCTSCDYSCKFTNNMKRHQLTHSDVRAFECDSCDRTFKSKPLLKNHMLTHTFTKPYNCVDCDVLYTTLQDLKKHLKSHPVQ